MPEIDPTIFDRVRAAFIEMRKKRGFQRDIAKITGIPKNTLTAFAKGYQSEMGAKYFNPLCAAIGFDPATGRYRSPERTPDFPVKGSILKSKGGGVFSSAPDLPGEIFLSEAEARMILDRRRDDPARVFAIVRDEIDYGKSLLPESDRTAHACLKALSARIDDYLALSEYHQALHDKTKRK